MKFTNFQKAAFSAVLIFSADCALAQLPANVGNQAIARQSAENADSVVERNVRAHLNFLASDALQGRGSGTQFELIAAHYLASQLQQFGVEPAGENDAAGKPTFIQTVTIERNSFAANPRLNFSSNNSAFAWEHGKEILALRLNAGQISGGLQKITLDTKPQPGAVVFVRLREGETPQILMQNLQSISNAGAAAVIVEETQQWRNQWNSIGARPVSFSRMSNNAAKPFGLIVVSREAAKTLGEIQDGTQIEIKGELAAPKKTQTWNAVGKIAGGDAALASEVILLSAHLDHLGVRENAQGEDKIFNGADDDASGCVAVLELARVLAEGKRPKRTVYFAFFGSEEAGGYGSQYFVNTLPFSKEKIAANLQFEMIGRPDPKVAKEQLWLTGYERSNLGAELARQGAKLVADPHPEQNFFQRSDNYTLARQGVVAHTVSSFGLHKDYHYPSDEIETIDFEHITRSINSMVKPVQWLVNSNFKPAWIEGKKP